MKNAAFLCISSLLALLLATACSPHIHDTFDVDSDTGATLDAQQRVILVTRHGGDGTQRIVCAEPSPDTMSAIAAAARAAGGNGEVQANLSYAVSQSAASIGIRTPTIQLLRDGLYRACEGYLNGVLDKTAYEIILRNYDRIMVALLGCAQRLLLPASAGICRGTRASEAARPDFHRPSGLRQPPAAGGAVAGGGFSWPPARAAADAKARAVGGQAEAEHQQAASRAQGLPAPSAWQDDRPAEPSMGR
jgi:hypothetical protein